LSKLTLESNSTPIEIQLISTSSSSVIKSDQPWVNFGMVDVGDSSSSTITLTNDFNNPVEISQVKFEGKEFVIRGLETPFTLEPNQKKELKVYFTPTSKESVISELTVLGNMIGEYIIPLFGQVVDGGIVIPKISSNTLNFGEVKYGGSKTVKFKIGNTGQADLKLETTTISDKQYSLEPKLPISVKPKEEVELSVVFSPTSKPTDSNTLKIKTNATIKEPNLIFQLNGTMVGSPPLHVKEVSVETFIGEPTSFQLEPKDGKDLSKFTLTTKPENRTLTDKIENGKVSLTYTPNSGFTGTDSFKYKVSDGTSDSEETQIDITVKSQPTLLKFSEIDSVSINQSFSVQVLLDEIKDLAGWSFNLEYDPEILVVESLEEGDFLKKDGGTTFFQKGTTDEKTGVVTGISSAYLGTGGISNTGNLLTINLKSIKDGEGYLRIKGIKFGNPKGAELPIKVINTTVTVSSVPPCDVKPMELSIFLT